MGGDFTPPSFVEEPGGFLVEEPWRLPLSPVPRAWRSASAEQRDAEARAAEDHDEAYREPEDQGRWDARVEPGRSAPDGCVQLPGRTRELRAVRVVVEHPLPPVRRVELELIRHQCAPAARLTARHG